MSKQNFEAVNLEIRQMIKDKLNMCMEPADIEDELLFGSSSGFDSTGLLEFILALEDRYDIIVPDEDLIPGNFGSITQITNYVIRMKEE